MGHIEIGSEKPLRVVLIIYHKLRKTERNVKSI